MTVGNEKQTPANSALTREAIDEKVQELEDTLFYDKTIKRTDRLAQLAKYRQNLTQALNKSEAAD